jgi:Domain of unknown function (DUF4333)
VASGNSSIALQIAVVCAVVLGAGCSKVLDTSSVEREIERGIERQLSDVNVTVECPDDIAAGEGERFECIASTDADQRARIAVVQTDDEGTIDFEVRELVDDE